MNRPVNLSEAEESIQAVLGYLNFSSGSHDPHFFQHLNRLYQYCDTQIVHPTVDSDSNTPLWKSVTSLLQERLQSLQQQNSSFANNDQASLALINIQDRILPQYLNFHSDLLFHQSESSLYGPFFIGRAFECFLAEINRSTHWNEDQLHATIDRLNDYVGYRPVAVLENDRKMEPYAHEWCRPIPLYVQGAGVAYGTYAEIISEAIAILRGLPQSICNAAQFELENLKELAFDPRPYDFDHPVNKRPNYQFGLWDPLSVDNRGFYSRFVIQQTTLDILLDRVTWAKSETKNQKLFESAAALAGTMLMASAVSGNGPDAYTSDISLGQLLPVIARFREAFYDHLLAVEKNNPHVYSKKLVAEAEEIHQPFGGVRRFLNTQLSRRRAQQLEYLHLAMIYARINKSEAAQRQILFVPAASTKIRCELECLFSENEILLRDRKSSDFASRMKDLVKLFMRGIHCGAIVDPWNILGFDSNFSLFPALENSVPDHRVGVLIDLVDRIFSQFSRGLCLVASEEVVDAVETISEAFNQFSNWWDQFAVEFVTAVESVSGDAVCADAQIAAKALSAWQQAGATSGDVRFWQPFVGEISSPKGYVLLINALLDSKDFVAAMHLLMHWLSHSDQVNLQKGSDLFHVIANRWLNEVMLGLDTPRPEDKVGVWLMVEKFFDFLEANSGDYARVPEWGLADSVSGLKEESFDSIEGAEDDVFSAAYEEVVYRDSTDDGVDGEILGSETDNFGLNEEARRISERLGFLVTIMRLWKCVVATALTEGCKKHLPLRDRFQDWRNQSQERQTALLSLLKSIERCDLPQPLPTSESLVEYDRNLAIHEVLIERVIDAYLIDVETTQLLTAAALASGDRGNEKDHPVACLMRAALQGDQIEIKSWVAMLMEGLAKQNLLYIPLARGGTLRNVVETKGHQRNIKMVLDLLPRMGLLKESISLLRVCANRERAQLGRSGSVTEFDQIFFIANQRLISSIVLSVGQWSEHTPKNRSENCELHERLLIDYLEQLLEQTAQIWIEHSQTLRLSVLEKVYADKKWEALVNFIRAHGRDIFTQEFLHLGNLRAILHRGVSLWVEEKMASSEQNEWSIYSIMDTEENKQKIVGHLQVVIEAIVENYGEYKEYNGTTTQSDQGGLLYMFLDILRLRSSYDRIAWNLIPALQVHEILLRHGRVNAAESWRLEMVERTRDSADEIVRKLRDLEQRYGMRLSTIAHRIEERFIQTLDIGRAKILIRKCMENENDCQSDYFPLLVEQIDELAQEPTGAGLDLPHWIATLEEEVTDYHKKHLRRIREDITEKISPRYLSRDELEDQLQNLA